MGIQMTIKDTDAVTLDDLIGMLPNSKAAKEVKALRGQTLCDACNKPITDDQRNVGHECDLHEGCADFTVPESWKQQ